MNSTINPALEKTKKTSTTINYHGIPLTLSGEFDLDNGWNDYTITTGADIYELLTGYDLDKILSIAYNSMEDNS